jgi:hypothetical protein
MESHLEHSTPNHLNSPSQIPIPPTDTKPVSTAPSKPKSTKSRPRSPSPSPPPPPPPPLRTIRLDIALGGPDNYEVDVSNLSKATGQRPQTPVPLKRDTSDSEGGDDDADGKTKQKKKRVRTTDHPFSPLSLPCVIRRNFQGTSITTSRIRSLMTRS